MCLSLYVCWRVCLCGHLRMCVFVRDDPAQATAGPQPWLQHGQHWRSQDALAAFTKVGRDRVIRPPSPWQSHLQMPRLSQDTPKSTPVGIFGWDVWEAGVSVVPLLAWWRGWVGWAGLVLMRVRDSFAFYSVPRFFLGILHYVIHSVQVSFRHGFPTYVCYCSPLCKASYFIFSPVVMKWHFLLFYSYCVKVRMFTFHISICSLYTLVCLRAL